MQVQMRADNESAWEENISAWVDGDGEVRPEDLDSPYGRQVWDTYHVIGDVLRSKDLAIQPSDLFYARLSKAIDNEPPLVTPRRRPSAARVGLSGLAIAAVAAAVVWVSLPMLAGLEQGATQQSATIVASADDGALTDYVDAHRQFAGVNPVRQVSWHDGVTGR